MNEVTIIRPYNPANPYDGWSTGKSFPLTVKGIEEALQEAIGAEMLLVEGCQPFDTTCAPRKILAEAKRAAKDAEKPTGLVPVKRSSEPSFALQHAGPYPMGSTWAADIPEGMTLVQIGAELLRYGTWVFGGRYRGEGWERYGIETADSEGVKFEDFEIFSLGPGAEPALFGLAIEFNSNAQLVLTLYLDGRAFAGSMGRPGENLLRFQAIFAEACQAMRSKADTSGAYPGGVTWDPKSGIGRAN